MCSSLARPVVRPGFLCSPWKIHVIHLETLPSSLPPLRLVLSMMMLLFWLQLLTCGPSSMVDLVCSFMKTSFLTIGQIIYLLGYYKNAKHVIIKYRPIENTLYNVR